MSKPKLRKFVVTFEVPAEVDKALLEDMIRDGITKEIGPGPFKVGNCEVPIDAWKLETLQKHNQRKFEYVYHGG